VTRVLLLLPTTSYRTGDFLRAAEELGVEVTVASEEPSTLEAIDPTGLLTLDFRDPGACARRVVELARTTPISAVVGVDEETVVAATAISAALGLPHNPPSAVAAARHKGRMRELLVRGGAPSPAFRVFPLDAGPEGPSREVGYPCVLKPTILAASRGVIRADSPEEFRAAWKRIETILGGADVVKRGGAVAREILVEDFIPGEEVALEGLLTRGTLRTLALFDKPDPLDGPFFEETIYVTPSRQPDAAQEAIRAAAARGAEALGLRDGPIHAELRWNAEGPWILEIAARSIGGLCARTLRFGAGMSLEELVLRHALGLPVPAAASDGRAAGVMMIPIPAAGVLEEVRGLDAARAVEGIADVTISAHLGQRLVPLPEGSRYLGFVFSRADDPASAEAALREAHAKLEFVIRSTPPPSS
jgi:biotin carboxylase